MAELILQGNITENAIDEVHLFFSTMQSDEIEMTSDATDHYVEDNTAVQDNIALPPIKFTLRGLVGEKVFKRVSPFVDANIVPYLRYIEPVAALVPAVSSYMQTVISASVYAEDTIRKYQNYYDENIKGKSLTEFFTKNQAATTLQQEVICQKLLEIRKARQFVAVQNDFGYFENYLIENARMVQSDTTSQSELVVSLKEFRFVSTETTKIDKKKYSSYVATQRAAEQNIGKVQGKKEELKSIAYRGYTELRGK